MKIQFFSNFKVALQYRPYFFISFVLTLFLFLILQFLSPWTWSTCLLISWNLAVTSYLILSMKTIWHADHFHILQRAQQQDASKWLILLLVFLTLLMCFIAIVVEVNHLPHLVVSYLRYIFKEEEQVLQREMFMLMCILTLEHMEQALLVLVQHLQHLMQ